MRLNVPEELKHICGQIVKHHYSLEEWCECESDDEFQSEHFCGGFDADEKAFCFSFYDEQNREWWFHLTLDEINDILYGRVTALELKTAK